MKLFIKSTTIIVIVLVILASTTLPVFAAASYPYNESRRLNTTTSWQTIATDSTGFNCDVFIQNNNTSVARSDVRMLGKSGNVLWTGTGALPVSGNGTFWCGADVYTIQIRTQSGKGTAFARPA